MIFEPVKSGPMTRAKLAAFAGNVAVAIGNSGDAAAHAVLNERSPDRPSADDPMVQQHVAWARDMIGA
jgi:epoxyqueuosine reductase QueG